MLPSAADVRRRRDASVTAWEEWSSTLCSRGRDGELVLRSALALKLLTYVPTGAMAAAATTSLPEKAGGDRNYDYRYGWIRDTSFVLTRDPGSDVPGVGQGHARADVDEIAGNDPLPPPRPTGCADTCPMPRFRFGRAVTVTRSPSAAAIAPSISRSGETTETCSNACGWRWDRAGAHLDAASADLLASLGDHVCNIWTEPDCGIWELDERRHNTFSKAGCWGRA